MITVEYDEKACAVTVSGHAGSAEAGKDLVCAACSMLACGLAHALIDLCAPPKLRDERKKHWKTKDGYTHIEWRAKSWEQARAKVIFEAYMSGFRELARENPAYVRCVEK